MSAPTVYIETSIVSYLAARPSRDPVTARNQALTHAWWNDHRHRYALYTSQPVLDEAAQGDPHMVQARSYLLARIPLLAFHRSTLSLADLLRARIPLPPRASEDAVHIALGALHQMDYLLTWDRKHIANPRLRSRIELICLSQGLRAPRLCTPEDLIEE